MAFTESVAELQRPQYHKDKAGKDMNERQTGITCEDVIQRCELRQPGISWANGCTVAMNQYWDQMRRPPHYDECANQRQKADCSPHNAAGANARLQVFHLIPPVISGFTLRSLGPRPPRRPVNHYRCQCLHAIIIDII